MNNFNIKLPDDVQFIIHTLQLHGFEAYAVGGCVRDSILGREPGDWDITTSAMPEETKALFDKTFDTGIEHGTITVLLNHEGYEVTTYRIDGKYEDSRHPKEVTFTRNLKEDLLRRILRSMPWHIMTRMDRRYLWRNAGSGKAYDPLCGKCQGTFLGRCTPDFKRRQICGTAWI